MMVFAGTSNIKLASDIAKNLKLTLGQVEISKFANGELRVWVKEEKVNSQAILVQSLSAPVETYLMELCLMADALARIGVHDITAVIPWLGYSKQDKIFRTGEPLSVKVIAKMLQVVPLKRLITFDLHNLAILGFFEIPVINLSAKPLFVDYFKKRKSANTLVVAPDAGSVKISTSFAQELNVPVVYMDKKRDLGTGEVKVLGMSRPVDGAQVIITDDMIVTGSTMIETANFLKKAGATKILVGATHHLYVDTAQEDIENSGIDEVVVTDTIAPKIKSKKLTVLPVSSIIASEIAKQNY